VTGIVEALEAIAGQLHNMAILALTNDRRPSAEQIATFLTSAGESIGHIVDVLKTPIDPVTEPVVTTDTADQQQVPPASEQTQDQP
jgi:hypothetical protein